MSVYRTIGPLVYLVYSISVVSTADNHKWPNLLFYPMYFGTTVKLRQEETCF